MKKKFSRSGRVLTDRSVMTVSAGWHADLVVPGLRLLVAENKRVRRWELRIQFRNKRRDIGLGVYPDVGLADARAEAQRLRLAARSGDDPLAARREKTRPVVAPETPKVISFGEYADGYVAKHIRKLKNLKSQAAWKRTPTKYCAAIRSIPINEIDTDAVKSVLMTLWDKTPETADRVRGRIENILDAAKVDRLRDGENPARWRGHLQHLADFQKRGQEKHQPALPYERIPEFMAALRLDENIAARLLEFCILTAARPVEARGALWSEIDLDEGVRIIPGSRMKEGLAHKVPLSPRAREIIQGIKARRTTEALKANDLVFVNPNNGSRYSENAMAVVLERVKERGISLLTTTTDRDGNSRDAVPHGFRSSFADWANDCTKHASEEIELALAHKVANKVAAAYRRGNMFEKRRELADDWAKYCASIKVIPFKKRRAS